jgi:hypothetical protein
MKLAEALLERKSLMEKVETLRERLMQNALVQEGDAPAEQPEALMRELDETVTQLETLIRRINATNNAALLPDGATVSEAIVRRDMLNLRRASMEQVADTAAVRQNRFTLHRGQVRADRQRGGTAQAGGRPREGVARAGRADSGRELEHRVEC